MSVIEHAKAELAAINFGDEDSRVMIEILEKFFSQWDSGGAVWAVAPVLQRLIAGRPLSPLTGADDEWCIHDFDDDMYAQNCRDGMVFKRRDGTAYTIENPQCERVPVIFPYWSDRAEVGSPVMEIETRSTDDGTKPPLSPEPNPLRTT